MSVFYDYVEVLTTVQASKFSQIKGGPDIQGMNYSAGGGSVPISVYFSLEGSVIFST